MTLGTLLGDCLVATVSMTLLNVWLERERMRLGLLTSEEEDVLKAVFALQGNAYGFTIMRHVEDARKRSIAIGSVYNSIRKLEKMKYVYTATDGIAHSNRGGRNRLMVTPTAKGTKKYYEERK